MKIGLVYMASGYSRRFGENKLLYKINGIPMYQYGLSMIQELILRAKNTFTFDPVVVSQYEEILIQAELRNMKAVYNANSGQGITASIHLGVNHCDKDCSQYMFLVADQPYLSVNTVFGFLQGYAASTCSMGCVCDNDNSGNPAIFSANWKEQLYRLTQDQGGKKIIKAYPKEVYRYSANAAELRDIDTVDDINN